jgi:hypothetical protein
LLTYSRNVEILLSHIVRIPASLFVDLLAIDKALLTKSVWGGLLGICIWYLTSCFSFLLTAEKQKGSLYLPFIVRQGDCCIFSSRFVSERLLKIGFEMTFEVSERLLKNCIVLGIRVLGGHLDANRLSPVSSWKLGNGAIPEKEVAPQTTSPTDWQGFHVDHSLLSYVRFSSTRQGFLLAGNCSFTEDCTIVSIDNRNTYGGSEGLLFVYK